MPRIDILSLNLSELEAILQENKMQKFRAKQIFDWLHVKNVTNFEEMSNLSKDMRVFLQETFYISKLFVEKKFISKIDDTVKFLFKIKDNEYIETVVMRYNHGNSICISTQIGCKMGCEFCASTKAGFVRNLSSGEMLSQIYTAQKELDIKITNIVLMGIGEPLDNYSNTVKFLYLINDKNGANISLRNVSLSTCGVVDKIDELAKLKLGLTLSISLHATENDTRSQIMPINHKWNIQKLLQACKNYSNITSRRISFEYALIKNVNDKKENAQQLAKLLRGQLCHVNLIPVNYVKEADFETVDRKSVYAFQNQLKELGINATIRRTLGKDIDAACGQLRRDNQDID